MEVGLLILKQTIKESRESMCLSQNQFAEYFEIPLGTLQNWERHRSFSPRVKLEITKKGEY